MPSSAPPQIPGNLVPDPRVFDLRDECARLLEKENTRFPGAQPVSFAREHLSELKKQEYFMAEKTDGIRCLMFLHFKDLGEQLVPATYLIDRKNNYYEVEPPVKFPYFQFPYDDDKYLFNTIFDGELVNDQKKGEPEPQLVYYIFDCLAFDGMNYTSRTLDRRIGAIKNKVFDVLEAFVKRHRRLPGPEPFKVRAKQAFPPYSVQAMFDQILPSLPHGNDGLIFTCKDTNYQFGTDRHILKWKPPQENTIDFKLKLGNFPMFDPEDGEEGLIPDYEARPDRIELQILHNNKSSERFTDLHFTDSDWEMLKSLNQRLDGRIIECYRDHEGHWRFKKDDDGTPRWRDDKKEANHISTVKSVLESIEDPVTQQDLLDASPSIREAVKRIRADEAEVRRRQEWQHQQQAQHEAKKRKIGDANGPE